MGRDRGGTFGLGELIREHFEAVEADFQRHYNIDLRQALWGPEPFGVRRLLALVRQLPTESSLHRELDGSWTMVHELLATLCELVDVNNRMFLQANSEKGTKVPKALQIPRPYERKAPPKRLSTIEEQRAFFEHVKVQGGE